MTSIKDSDHADQTQSLITVRRAQSERSQYIHLATQEFFDPPSVLVEVVGVATGAVGSAPTFTTKLQ